MGIDSGTAPAAKAEMLIRRPVAEVFEAFVDPAQTTRFWFTKSSGRLEEAKRVKWEWEMYGASSDVEVRVLERNKRIVVQWEAYGISTVEWGFTERSEESTFVSITHTGFQGSGNELIQQVAGSTEGFAIVLAGAKALLEHGIELNLVRDRFPDGVPGSDS